MSETVWRPGADGQAKSDRVSARSGESYDLSEAVISPRSVRYTENQGSIAASRATYLALVTAWRGRVGDCIWSRSSSPPGMLAL